VLVCISGREPWSTTASLVRGDQHPTAEWLAQQIAEAFPWDTAPRYLIRDNDGAYGQAFTNRVRRMGIRDRPIAPRSPWQNPYVERLIGTLRRECMDHVLIYGERHLSRLMKPARTSAWPKTHRYLGRCNDPEPSSRRQFCPDCIIATRGYDFQEGQVLKEGERDPTEPRDGDAETINLPSTSAF
jgi:Integrase core domain